MSGSLSELIRRFRSEDRAAYFVTRSDTLSLVLGILGVTQSLAVGKLVDDINFAQRQQSVLDWHLLPHWLLAFCIIIKVFETVFLGAVDSMSYRIGFHSISTLFALGGFQNWAFDAINLSGNGQVIYFHFRLLLFSGFALMAYSVTFYGIWRGRLGKELSVPQRRREITNETSNLMTSLVFVIFCFVGWQSTCAGESALISSILSVLLIANISLSLWIANVQMIKGDPEGAQNQGP